MAVVVVNPNIIYQRSIARNASKQQISARGSQPVHATRADAQPCANKCSVIVMTPILSNKATLLGFDLLMDLDGPVVN